MQYESHPSIVLISGRDLGDLDLKHKPFSFLYQLQLKFE